MLLFYGTKGTSVPLQLDVRTNDFNEFPQVTCSLTQNTHHLRWWPSCRVPWINRNSDSNNNISIGTSNNNNNNIQKGRCYRIYLFYIVFVSISIISISAHSATIYHTHNSCLHTKEETRTRPKISIIYANGYG